MKAAILRIPVAMTAPRPALAMAAPASPPIRACDELVGSPKYQVVRFQRMAPNSPLSTT